LDILGSNTVLLSCKGKIPLRKSWPELTPADMTPDYLRILENPRRNIGVLMGPSVCCIDIDDPNEVERFLAGNPKLRKTFRISGKPGRQKIFVRTNGACPPKFALKRSGRIVGEFLGVGAQAVVSGNHPDTRSPYIWIYSAPPVEIDLPQVILGSFDAPNVFSKRDGIGTTRSESPEYTENTESTESNCTHCITSPPHPLENLRRRKEVLAELSAIDPRLPELFKKNVEPFYGARPKQRHDTMNKAVEFLYRCVAVNYVELLLECWYRLNAHIFTSSHAEHMTDLMNAIAGTKERYLADLPQDEAQLYSELPEDKRCAFRIGRDLAQRGNGRFFITCADLAGRLGTTDMTAWRILRWFVAHGVLLPLSPGKKRAHGQRGEAAEFKWFQPLCCK